MLERWLGLVAAGVLLAGVTSARAEVAVPPLKAHVTDLTGTLSAQQLQDLESRLSAFERRKGSQIAVLMLPSTQPETIEEYSIRVADAWKIGRARVDDGVILVVAKNDRKLRIEVGRGLEGAIPDAVGKRVVSDVIAPRLRSGDFHGGIAAGTDALMKVIEGEPLPAPAASGAFDRGFDFLTIAALIAALLIFGLFGVFFVLAAGSPRSRGWSSGLGGGWSTGGWSGGDSGGGGFGGGGGFSGGGGDFGGGGASGSW